MMPEDAGETQDTSRIILVVLLLATGFGAALLAENSRIALATIGLALLVALTQPLHVLQGAFVALVLIELPLQADVYLGRDETIADTAALSGYVVSLATAALVVLMIAWWAERAAGTRALIPRTQLSISSWVYLGWVGLSVIWALDPTRALQEFWLIGQAVILFAYLRNHVTSAGDVARLRFLLVLALLSQGLVVMATEAFGPLTLGPIQTFLAGSRATGTLGSPNALGSFVTMLLPLAIVGLRRDSGRVTKWVSAAAATLGLVALILSSSRGAWIGSAVAVGTIVTVGAVRGWFSRRTAVTATLGSLVAIAVFGGQVLLRLAAYDNAAAQARGPLNRLALQIIGGQPWLGVGANNFSEAMGAYIDVSFADAWISTVHNKYLLVWSETGIVGLLVFLWFLWAMGSMAVRLGGRGAPLAPEAIAVFAALVGTALHMLVEIFHGRVQYETLWILAALLEGIRNVRMRREGAPLPAGSVP